MKLRAVLGVMLLVAATSSAGAIGAAPAVATTQCPGVVPGKPLSAPPWPQDQLRIQQAWSASEGEYVTPGRYEGQPFSAGQPVPIAVIDSGFDNRNPAFTGAKVRLDTSILPRGTTDCVGHGTQVISVISAQPTNSSPLVGVAPQASVLAIKYTNQDENGSSYLLAKALRYAISQHVRVINLSSQLATPPIPQVMTQLVAARRAGIVIVAAGGNDSAQTGNGPYWPAKLSTRFANIIAVSATDQNGQPGGFGVTGHYVDVAAPGVDVPVATRLSGFVYAKGTSYATPYVTGTVALMLASHPDMTPAEVKNRLEATADPPPGSQPNAAYGWGVIDPVNAITSLRNDAVATPTPEPGRPLPAPQVAAAPNRSLEHRALAIAVVLLGLAALTVTGAAVLRGSRRAPARRS